MAMACQHFSISSFQSVWFSPEAVKNAPGGQVARQRFDHSANVWTLRWGENLGMHSVRLLRPKEKEKSCRETKSEYSLRRKNKKKTKTKKNKVAHHRLLWGSRFPTTFLRRRTMEEIQHEIWIPQDKPRRKGSIQHQIQSVFPGWRLTINC